MTQTIFDNIVLGIANYEGNLAHVCVQMTRQNDPDASRRAEELMMLQNVLFGLRHYDISSEIFTDAEISYYFELATQVIQSCPL